MATFGFVDEPVGPIEPDDYELRSPMGHILSDLERDHEFRQFQFLGAISQDYAVGCALTSSTALSSGFVYLCRTQDRELIELRLRVRPDDELVLARDPDQGESRLRSPKGNVTMYANVPRVNTCAGKALNRG